MRLISFSMTTPQIKARTKTVTRRLGWRFLKAGDRLMAIEKGQGLKKGEKVVRLGVIEVVDVRRERLDRMSKDSAYGFAECKREGFATDSRLMWPSAFVEFFAASHRCQISDEVTRIEFRYVGEGTA